MHISLCNEIASLAANYMHTLDEWFLDEIKSVLKSIDSDVNYRPLPENPGLRNFVEAEECLTQEEAEEVVEECVANWKTTGSVTAQNVMRLHMYLKKSTAFLRYRYLRAFITEGCFQLEKSSFGEEDEENGIAMIEALLSTIDRILGPPETSPSISASDQDIVLAAILEKLKEIKASAIAVEEQTKSVFGDAAFSSSVYDI